MGRARARSAYQVFCCCFERVSHATGDSLTSALIISYSALAANVSLLTFEDSRSGEYPAAYAVEATTSNGPGNNNTLNFISQPFGSHLKVSSVGKNSPTSVKVAPAFEGTFDIVASRSTAEIIVDDETKDPSGEGKKRVVKYQKQEWLPWIVTGSARWVKEDETETAVRPSGPSFVKLVTSNAPATLIFA